MKLVGTIFGMEVYESNAVEPETIFITPHAIPAKLVQTNKGEPPVIKLKIDWKKLGKQSAVITNLKERKSCRKKRVR